MTYFITYAADFGRRMDFGNCSIEPAAPITCLAQVQELGKELAGKLDAQSVTVLSWQPFVGT